MKQAVGCGAICKDLEYDYVFHSCITSYAVDVFLVTGNKGVNVVLNSIGTYH